METNLAVPRGLSTSSPTQTLPRALLVKLNSYITILTSSKYKNCSSLAYKNGSEGIAKNFNFRATGNYFRLHTVAWSQKLKKKKFFIPTSIKIIFLYLIPFLFLFFLPIAIILVTNSHRFPSSSSTNFHRFINLLTAATEAHASSPKRFEVVLARGSEWLSLVVVLAHGFQFWVAGFSGCCAPSPIFISLIPHLHLCWVSVDPPLPLTHAVFVLCWWFLILFVIGDFLFCLGGGKRLRIWVGVFFFFFCCGLVAVVDVCAVLVFFFFFFWVTIDVFIIILMNYFY